MFRMRLARGWLNPVCVWLLLLAIVFMAEYGVMLLLPRLLPQHSSRLLESVVDSIILTLIVAPVLWLMIVRPLKEIIRLRSQFLTNLFAQIESDRRQTAYELHDGVGQSLTLLISGLRSAKSCRANVECNGRVNEFQRLAENALTEVRRLAMGLRPSLLDDLGLVPALERLCEDVRGNQAVEIELQADDLIGLSMSEEISTAIFRIVQEALTNVVKHSQAKHAQITARAAGGQVRVVIGDDGRGIEPTRLRSLPAGHLGLSGMRERASLLGGEFSIESAPGRGTRITFTVPIPGARSG